MVHNEKRLRCLFFLGERLRLGDTVMKVIINRKYDKFAGNVWE
jgi:hypothetical protein